MRILLEQKATGSTKKKTIIKFKKENNFLEISETGLALLGDLPNGEGYLKAISGKLPRSLAQNSLYWLYLTLIQNETGETKELLHLKYSHMFLKPIGESEFGKVFRSTTELKTDEFKKYMEAIEEETQIEIPYIPEYK